MYKLSIAPETNKKKLFLEQFKIENLAKNSQK